MRLPEFPPKLSQFIKKANPLRHALEDAQELVRAAAEDIRETASALRGEKEVEETEEERIRGGTAGSICSDEHISQAASDIEEALRMARSRGIKDSEVRKRLKAARAELNAMERWDMSAEKIVSYPKEQQEIARWLLPKSAAIRHTINEILMREGNIEDLEKLSAYAKEVAGALTDKIDSLPKEQKERDECIMVKSLKTFLEERKIKKGG